jgi:hypothetical protein
VVPAGKEALLVIMPAVKLSVQEGQPQNIFYWKHRGFNTHTQDCRQEQHDELMTPQQQHAVAAGSDLMIVRRTVQQANTWDDVQVQDIKQSVLLVQGHVLHACNVQHAQNRCESSVSGSKEGGIAAKMAKFADISQHVTEL